MANGRPYFSFVSKRSNDITQDEVERNLRRRLHNAESIFIDENDKYKEMLARKRKMEVERAKNQLALYESNKEVYTALYSIQDTVSSEIVAKDDRRDTRTAEAFAIKTDDENNLSLKINMLHPIGASITVVDGKVEFSPEEMTPEKMAEMVDFLRRHGIVVDTDSLKLENADEKTQEIFEDAKEIFEERTQEAIESLYTRTKHDENYEDSYLAEEQAEIEKWFEENSIDDREVGQVSQIDDPDLVEELTQDNTGKGNNGTEETGGSGGEDGSETSGEAEEKGEESKPGEKAPKKPAKKKMTAQEQLKEFDASIEGWMNKNKRKNYSWYDGTCWNGGWRTFTCYTSESNDPLRKPITVDPKTKDIKCNYEFKIYTRIGPNGKVEIAYSLPPGKKLTDDQAYLLASAFKDAGIKYVEYAGMPDDDEAIMRGALAKRALIPVGHKINAERYDKMTGIAKGKLDENSPEMYRYKYDLAMQMERILAKKGIDWRKEENRNNPDCRRIRWAVGSYQLYPFRDLWEDFHLRDKFESKVSEATPGMGERGKTENGAPQVIGATMAVVSLYKMFEHATGEGYTVDDLLKGKGKLTPSEVNALRNALGGKDGPETEIRDLSPRVMLAIYEEMCKTQTKAAEEDLNNRYLEALRINKETGSKNDNLDKSIISDALNNARARIEDVNGQLDDCGLKKIYLTRFSLPRYQFTEAREQAKREGLIGEEEKGGKAGAPKGPKPAGRRGGAPRGGVPGGKPGGHSGGY